MENQRSLLTEQDIIAASVTPAPTKCGVYFLIKEDRIVYVGKSVNIEARLLSHVTRGHDSWHWVPCEREGLDALERRYINAFLPPWNMDPETRSKRGDRWNEPRPTSAPSFSNPLSGVDPNWWVGIPEEELGWGEDEARNEARERMLRVRAMRRAAPLG